MTTDAIELGPFSADRGTRSMLAAAAATLAASSVLALGARIILDAIAPAESHRWATRAAMVLALGASVAALGGLYDTAVRGRRGAGWVKATLGIAALAGSVAYIHGAAADGTLRLDRFFSAFFEPDLIRSTAWPIARAAWNALRLALIAQVFAMAFGLLVATLRLSPRWWLRGPAVAYVDVMRSVPLIVLTLLIYGGLPKLGITLPEFGAAVFILTLNAGAYISEIFRAGIQSLSKGQVDAARSLGMPYGTSMLFVVIPQAVRAVIPPLMSEFIALLKDTAVVLLGIGVSPDTWDLFNAARAYTSSTFSSTPLVVATIGYIIMIVPMVRLVGWAERRARAGLA